MKYNIIYAVYIHVETSAKLDRFKLSMKYMCLWAVAEKAAESKKMRVSWFSPRLPMSPIDHFSFSFFSLIIFHGSHQGFQRVQLSQPSEEPPAQTVGYILIKPEVAAIAMQNKQF